MNCDKCQDLISDLLDGSLSSRDQSVLQTHLEECLECAGVRDDLHSIVGFCQAHRGEYEAPPNERALWQRIRNIIESDASSAAGSAPAARQSIWSNWLARSWELSFPQLAALVAAIVLVVSLSTAVGLWRYQSGDTGTATATAGNTKMSLAAESVNDRISQQQQLISFWNQRVEYNKARWSPQMRETFDRNLQVIDQAVNESFNSLSQNPHDEVSEEMLNAALNEKLSLLKEFAEL
ncbi:MAG TPA: anti-sigma factor [Pyrinomonadaceae bacterium]|jgi:predicted anti-sigma-YlaC factor YlaD|nr:anti-sigma factor [Pyrinomonadaceae bacterium]